MSASVRSFDSSHSHRSIHTVEGFSERCSEASRAIRESLAEFAAFGTSRERRELERNLQLLGEEENTWRLLHTTMIDLRRFVMKRALCLWVSVCLSTCLSVLCVAPSSSVSLCLYVSLLLPRLSLCVFCSLFAPFCSQSLTSAHSALNPLSVCSLICFSFDSHSALILLSRCPQSAFFSFCSPSAHILLPILLPFCSHSTLIPLSFCSHFCHSALFCSHSTLFDSALRRVEMRSGSKSRAKNGPQMSECSSSVLKTTRICGDMPEVRYMLRSVRFICALRERSASSLLRDGTPFIL